MMTNQEILKNVPLFAGINEESFSHMLSLLKEKKFIQGEMVVREGEAANALFIVKSGEAEVRKVINKDPYTYKTLAIIQSGGIFGEMALFTEEVRSADVLAREDLILWVLEYGELLKILETDPAGGIRMLKIIISILANRVKTLDNELVTIYDLGKIIPTLESLQELIEVVFNAAMRSIESARVGYVALYNLFNQEFDVHLASDPSMEKIIPLNDTVAAAMMKNKTPLLNNEASGSGSVLACPFLHEGNVLGYVYLSHPDRKNSFNYNQMILLSTVCTFVGSRINDLQRKEEERLKERLQSGKRGY